MEHFWRSYLPGEAEDGAPPYAAPLRSGDLSGLPPATILQAAADPLFTEGLRYGQRLAEAGIPVIATRYDGLVHGAFWMAALSPLTRAFCEHAGLALRVAHGAR
jgi:acetyl esterase